MIFGIAALFIILCTNIYAQEQDIAESFGLYSKGIDYYHKGKLYEAQETLEQAGIPCTIRMRRGIDIQAGCGQLAGVVVS